MSTQTAALFDRSQILEQIGGDTELFHNVIEVFLIDSPDIRQRLTDAQAGGTPEQLRAVAHCAKSAVGNFCVPAAVDAAISLENACKNGETERFETLTRQLCSVLIEVENALRAELPGNV